MTASVTEQLLARVESALKNATAAGAKVYRERDDAYGEDDVQTINIKRDDTSGEPYGDSGQVELVTWALELRASGGTPVQTADALHMQAHAVLWGDAALAAMGRGLRCTGTEVATESADRTVATLTAHYRMKVFVRPGDLTRAIT